MKAHFLLFILCICSVQTFYSQEDDGVVSLAIPTRNSLTFNRYTINPTFSFVREQTKYISIYNKREWIQFENAPLTYLASYSGRFGENIGAGLGLFQQNYGVLTTFGGILNFAYNARLGQDSNLTFGINVGAYKSGVNTANVVTNFEDPSLQNVPENFLLTINPGINYGTEFLDFGLSINNLALYNFESSELIEDNPQQGIQAHIMYTGYMDSRGFFDESKFSGLLRSEFQKEKTILSAIAMVTVPKGIWAQAGYNTLNGVSGGVGLNITTQIAIEYNYEKAIGDLNTFGSSHEITLAYRFKNNNYYDYSREDEVSGILSGRKKKRRISKTNNSRVASRKTTSKTTTKTESDAQAKLIAEQKAKAKAEEEQKAKELVEIQAELDKIEADKKAEQKAQEEAAAQAKLLAEQKAQEEAAAQAKLLTEQKAQEEAAAQAKLLAEQKAQEEAAAKAKLLAEQKAQEEAAAQAKLLAEQKAQEEAAAQAKLLAEQKAQEEAAAQAKLLAERKAQEEADEQAKDDAISNPTDTLAKSMQTIAKSTENSKDIQNELLKQFDDIVAIKDQDLKDLKEENDLSDQGITVKPKPFKSVTAENNALNAIKSDLENVIQTRSEKIDALNKLYEERVENGAFALDEVTLFYKKEIKRLKAEQLKAKEVKTKLDTKLEAIRVATEFEKRRRIKRAAFNNEEDRYSQDRAMLKNIKETTKLSDTPLKAEDFDFGEDLGNSIKILKNIDNVESGYYLIIAVHSDTKQRNKFVTNVVASGRSDVDFFHDVSTSKYYIFYNKFDNISDANEALKTKGNRPYNGKMSIVKIEN
ncbi:type IX secretion system membrane protein PorP/SprF [Winogradskyella psychrotolerans]|uniref:PorP/SprF family type IX secretion system membrane protein n=1 Tax=Winogradskyella psychrotolerans TaxID=1344585 RepID=UPI001C07310D|nr:type IX secretion system membrane protein PorP/SprF [Winogradskyella psychrotolerans]MBU2921039.1 type IX secretion system membrane protein PorP/SprF [Winogradskyella psychrotolerans]